MSRHVLAPRCRPAWSITIVLAVPAMLVGAAILTACSSDPGQENPAENGVTQGPTGSSSAASSVSRSPEKTDPSRGAPTPTDAIPTSGPSRGADDGSRSTASAPSYTPGEKHEGLPVAASKDGVTVKKLTSKSSGGGLWMPVEITNQGTDPASYAVEILVTGPGGFTANVRTTTSVLEPGRRASQALTAMDPSGAPVPEHPRVSIVSVVRTPS